MVVYDGFTGIIGISTRIDTAVIGLIVPKSPAAKEGLKIFDRIIQINDSIVAGKGLDTRDIRQLLVGKSGELIELKVLRRGEDTLRVLRFHRDAYLNRIESFSYEYLADSLEQWDISDIVSDSLNHQFVDVIQSKCEILTVKEGSLAAERGLQPGDLIISLTDEMWMDEDKNISSGDLHLATQDTSLTVLRDSAEIQINLNPSKENELEGVESRFINDMQQTCIWVRINTENMISEDRTYLFRFPDMRGADSVTFFEQIGPAEFVEKNAGATLSLESRDFIYKDWFAVKIHLTEDGDNTFYVKLKMDKSHGGQMVSVIAHDTILNHDRIERMIRFVMFGMMLVIAIYYIILFSATRHWRFLFFSLYVLSTDAYLFTSQGYLGEFQWDNAKFYAFVDYYNFEILGIAVIISFLLFGISYLDLRQHLKWWYRSVLIAIGLTGVSLIGYSVLASLEDHSLEVMENIFDVISMISVVFIAPFILVIPAILRILKGFKPAWYFLISNVLWIVAAIIAVFAIEIVFTPVTVYEPSFVTITKVSLVYIAVVIQFLLFSMGLAQKMRLDELEKKLAQERIIEQLKENERLKDKVNRELEQKVRERTKEISDQKEEIESQRDEIEAQRDQLKEQRDLVVAQKQELMDSITYAERIQAAVLPHGDYLQEVMPEHFIFYRPRDIVSGDFYWVKKVTDYLILVAADCTGHGVPGAFMSMLGIALLNEQIDKGRVDKPGEILNRLRSKVKDTLAQEGKAYEQQDGMDIALAIVDHKRLELQYAGAYNPVYIIRDKKKLKKDHLKEYYSLDNKSHQLIELKGDRQPIAIYSIESDFETKRVQLQGGDSLYLFSDGYMDQKGGPKAKKFLSRNFKRLLLEIQSLSMEDQKNHLNDTMEEWWKGYEQVDDILVMGVRV